MEDKNLEFVSNLRTVVGRLVKKLRRESASAQALSLTERSVLFSLQNKASLPNELAAAEKITNQSMSGILAHLLELGLITRTASATDKRKVLIALTAQGEQMIYQVRNERDQWLTKAIAATCTKEEQELLKKILVPLTKIVDFE